MRRAAIALALIGLAASASLVSAAQPEDVQKPIRGQGTMDDRNRAGPDGWSWAPVPRTDAPSGTAPGEHRGNPPAATGQ
jgi:hypothetical protein